MSPLLSKQDTDTLVREFLRNSDKKFTLILGAGASYGYSRKSDYTFTPPTVKKLFDSSNPVVDAVLNRAEHTEIRREKAQIQRTIQNRFNGDLEAYLSDAFNTDSEDPLFSRVVRYLEDLFTVISKNVDDDDNYYQSLVSAVRELRGRKPWSIVTFNYDTLLEQAISKSVRFTPSRQFRTEADYTSHERPKVIKVHGGVNVRYIHALDPLTNTSPDYYDVFTEMMENDKSLIEFSTIGSGIPPFESHRTFDQIGGRSVRNFPLMMIPVHAQTDCKNDFLVRQRELAAEEISQSGLTIAIGYQFGDDAFLNALKRRNIGAGQLVLVGSNSLLTHKEDSLTFKKASDVWSAENIRIFEGKGFGEFIDAVC